LFYIIFSGERCLELRLISAGCSTTKEPRECEKNTITYQTISYITECQMEKGLCELRRCKNSKEDIAKLRVVLLSAGQHVENGM
jgi:hypothetical protein